MFQILKAMITLEKQSHGLEIPLSRLFEDTGVDLSDPVTLNKHKTLNYQSVIALRPKGQTLNVSHSTMLKVKNEIEEEMAAAKKPTGEKKSNKAPKPNKKKKLVL